MSFPRYPKHKDGGVVGRDSGGAVWLQRMRQTWSHNIWLNPESEDRWPYYRSLQITRELMEDKIFPLTLAGLDRAIKALH